MPNGLAGSAQVSYPLLGPSGSSGAPTYSFASDPTLGFYRQQASVMGLAGYLVVSGYVASSTAFVGSSDAAFFSLGAANDVMLYRLAAASLRLGATPSATPVAQTFTIGEASRPGTDSNVAGSSGTIRSGLGTGTGTPSTLIFQVPIQAAAGTGTQTYGTVLTMDRLVGLTTTLPIFSGYHQADSFLTQNAWGRFGASADGVIVFSDTTAANLGRICFGGSTAAYPAIARSGANLALVPADGSAGYIDLTVHDVIGNSVYLSNLVGVGANNTNIGLSLTGFAMNIHNSAAALTLAVTGGATLATFAGTGYLEMYEVTAPAAPGANAGRLYFEDNGAGKTRLMCLFNTGAAQQIAIEP